MAALTAFCMAAAMTLSMSASSAMAAPATAARTSSRDIPASCANYPPETVSFKLDPSFAATYFTGPWPKTFLNLPDNSPNRSWLSTDHCLTEQGPAPDYELTNHNLTIESLEMQNATTTIIVADDCSVSFSNDPVLAEVVATTAPGALPGNTYNVTIAVTARNGTAYVDHTENDHGQVSIDLPINIKFKLVGKKMDKEVYPPRGWVMVTSCSKPVDASGKPTGPWSCKGGPEPITCGVQTVGVPVAADDSN